MLSSRLYGQDLDNLIKAVADALNKIAWYDDRYMVEVQATKELIDFEEYAYISWWAR